MTRPDRGATGPRVLVTTATRHGATAGIAEALARWLPEADPVGRLTAVCRSVEEDPDPAGYDAVVLGSAVYLGRWLPKAREWAHNWASVLQARPVWLFSSGPLGEVPPGTRGPSDGGLVLGEVGAREHRLLDGALDRSALRLRERAVVAVVRAPEGDFRDWDAVHAWAGQISAGVLAHWDAHRSVTPRTGR